MRAILLFAVLVGVLAFVGSFGQRDSAPKTTQKASGPDPQEVRQALEHIESAVHALEATDYGRTRWHLHAGQRTLTKSLK